MYIVDFFKHIGRKSNIPVIIYLVLNIFVIAGIISMMLMLPFWAAMLVGIVIYGISLVIALSPIGEWILRKQTGCNKIKRAEINAYIEPIFKEVYLKAREKDPTISPDVKLFMGDDPEPNAFATGRKTICITEGLLHVPEEQIKATLAHEFGHLSHKDTDLILVVSVGNMIVTAIIFFIKLMIDLMRIIFSIATIFIGGSEGALADIVMSLYHAAITLVVMGLTKLWTWIGTMLVMKSSRSNEYEADQFAFELGYGEDLCLLLDTIDGSHAQGLFATLASSHPASDDRIGKLQELGCTYRLDFRP